MSRYPCLYNIYIYIEWINKKVEATTWCNHIIIYPLNNQCLKNLSDKWAADTHDSWAWQWLKLNRFNKLLVSLSDMY